MKAQASLLTVLAESAARTASAAAEALNLSASTMDAAPIAGA
jgi:hypothetical protein